MRLFSSARPVGRSRLAALVLGGLLAMPVWALSPEIEADRLLLASKNYLENGDYNRARQSLERVQQLKVAPPAEYHFYRGKVAWHFQDGSEARKALETYVQEAGREAEHYQQALALLTEIEDSGAAATPAQGSGEADIQWQQNSVHSDAYVEQLRKLYLKDRPQDALIEHINSLLASAPYQPSRILKPDLKEGVRYSFSLGGKGIVLVQETRFEPDGTAKVNLDRREVFGIDPYVRFGCDKQRRACWIYDPQNEFREWVVLAEKPEIAEDLSKAVTKLLLTLQNPA